MLTLKPVADEPVTLISAIEELADARDEMLHHMRALNSGSMVAEFAIARLVDAARMLGRAEAKDDALRALARMASDPVMEARRGVML